MIRRVALAVLFQSTLLWGCNQGGGGTDGRTMSAVEAVPAGDPQCPAGGQKILTGIDVNGDGALETNEVTQVAYVCNGQSAARCTTLEGSITIHNSFDWANLVEAGCTRITGTLEINAQGAHVLGAPSPLVEVGAVLAEVNDALTRLEFPALAIVHGDVLIDRNDAMTSLDLSSLARVDGNLTIDQNALLPAVSLPSLTTVGGAVTVTYSPAVASLGLPGLTHVTGLSAAGLAIDKLLLPNLATAGALYLAENPALTRVDLSGLTWTDSLDLSNNPLLASIDASALVTVATFQADEAVALWDLRLPALTQVTDTFSLVDPTALVSLALPSLRSSGDFYVGDAPSLAYVDLHALETTGSFSLRPHGSAPADPTSLTELSLPSLVSVNGGFIIFWATRLEQLSIPVLATVARDFGVDNLYASGNSDAGFQYSSIPGGLQTLSAPALVSAGSVFAQGHASLTSFDLPVLSNVGRVSLYFNGAMVGLSLPQVSAIFGLDLRANAVLSSVNLPNLVSVGNDIMLRDNPAITELTLPALETAGMLWITGNAALTTVSFPALTSAGYYVDVIGNPALTSLDLPLLTHVTYRLAIKDNPVLPQCLAQTIADDLVAPIPSTITIANNDTTAICP